MQAATDGSRAIRLPSEQMTQLHRIKRTANTLRQQLNREPTHEELANALGVSSEDIAQIVPVAQPHVSLDAPLKDARTIVGPDQRQYRDHHDPCHRCECRRKRIPQRPRTKRGSLALKCAQSPCLVCYTCHQKSSSARSKHHHNRHDWKKRLELGPVEYWHSSMNRDEHPNPRYRTSDRKSLQRDVASRVQKTVARDPKSQTSLS